ncbi:MAG TPA: peptidoglycan-binding protein [Acidimicrobiales bacterium]
MRDLQHRLAALGFDTSGDAAGAFGDATAAAIRAFQERRGLPPTEACDDVTWEAVVEASWRLGDRPLYLTAPMVRGDDVATLQRCLGALGFDAGRVDGIFGLRTDRALADFQRNVGLVSDAICGPATVAALARLGDWSTSPHSVADIRERERFRRGPRTLAGRLVVLAHTGGLDAFATSAARAIGGAGASVLVVQHPDGSEQAAQANTAEADVFLGVGFGDGATCRAAYYASPTGWESPGGKLLAALVQHTWAPVLGGDPCGTAPMAVPILRETRMPAVFVSLGPPERVVERTAVLAAGLPGALESWVARFCDGD